MRSHFHNDIQRLHGTMPLLGVSHSVDLGDLFVDVNILEAINSDRRLEQDDLWQDFIDGVNNYSSYRSFDRIGLGNQQQRVSGLEVLDKNTNLMLLGKPGSGKTTYLQRIVTECNQGNLQPHRVPVLIKMREFVDDGCDFEYNLKPYLTQQWRLDKTETELILNHGKALILLDGLDEVSGTDGREISKKIQQFARNYPQNQLIVTCRTNRIEDHFNWKSLRFDFIEVADFNEQQVNAFVEHYFNAVNPSKQEGQKKAKEFLENFYLEENQNIRELAITPILLSLTCAVFHERGKFYSKRSTLYEEGLELLLKKWDDSKGIERDEIYKVLLPEQKQELLSYLAVKKFEQPQYVLFEQEEIEGYIADFLHITRRDSGVVLKAIETQHGLLIKRAQKVWSFSHLTFQEYFVAKWFCDQADFYQLFKHITQPQWREIFLLLAEMYINTQKFMSLMKQKIDTILVDDEKLQNILDWANRKSALVDNCRKLVAIRAFYLSMEVQKSFDNSLSRTIEPSFNPGISHVLEVDHLLYRCVFHAHNPDFSRSLYERNSSSYSSNSFIYSTSIIIQSLDFELFLDKVIELSLRMQPQLREALIKLKDKLPKDEERINYQQFWNNNKKSWIEDLVINMSNYRQISLIWQLNNEQKELFQQYYDANKLLIDCLTKAITVSDNLKQEIEETLLLPITEIENRKRAI
ncbi:NACHT domain-containing protein [Dolichospermum flos-aquae]|uniref:NACHT domain-containing NTPase n=1 Tax=Dolichospermum flos-aquae CCAP 1403/13F TaxID=315271 RepID=A0A6H2C0I9_DOLFA|nr:NACHT domain-containing protein [Dolichospermum flos-aquae]QJB44820.1 NACHT domain-containing NTPase [Dolichospermum flos-aquae CCAP 1403/13F]